MHLVCTLLTIGLHKNFSSYPGNNTRYVLVHGQESFESGGESKKVLQATRVAYVRHQISDAKPSHMSKGILCEKGKNRDAPLLSETLV